MGTEEVIDGILDTSVLIEDTDEALADFDGIFGISVLTLSELHHGAIAAANTRVRSRRIARLARIEATYLAIDIDRRVAMQYGEMAALTRRVATRPHVIDGLIAATAIVHGVPVFTRDDDFDRIPDVQVVKV